MPIVVPLGNFNWIGTYFARKSHAGKTSVLVTSTGKTIRSKWACVGSLEDICMHPVRR